MRILFVCGGNTCRSPMAAALATRMFPQIDAESAGVAGPDGRPAHAHAVAVMKAEGIDLAGHHTRKLDQLDLAGFDKIVALDHHVAADLKRKHSVEENSLIVWDVRDPWESDRAAYEATKNEIKRLLVGTFGDRADSGRRL